jgi:hypothetical protein
VQPLSQQEHLKRMPRKRQRAHERSYAAARATMDEILASRNRLNQASAEFLKIDVETALTFSQIARESQDSWKRQRNRDNARKGYETILRLIDKVNLTDDDARFLADRLEELRFNLRILGEVS